MRACVLHLAPHPDDESLGAVATLLALRTAGHRVINLACSLGRPAQHARRRAEVAAACDRADFELLIHEPPLAISEDDDLAEAQRLLAETVVRISGQERVDLLVSPSPHDRHHGHEVVGRAARDAARAAGLRWWMWGLGGELPLPTLFSGFGDATLERARHVLAAHAGEVARNDYVRLLGDRAGAAAVLGSERVFGWGGSARRERFAELLTEVAPAAGGLAAGPPRVLDPADPLPALDAGRLLDWWLDAASFTDRVAAARG